MACSKCKQVIDPSIPFAEFEYTPTAKFEQTAFVRPPNRPSKGWGVVLPLKGSPQKIIGNNPKAVAHAAVQLYKLNGFQVDLNALWFNLNIQWLEKTHPKYQLKPLTELLSITTTNDVVNNDTHAIKKIAPEEWIKSFWQFIKIYTEAETYSWEVFIDFLKQYQRMLNPNENALLGNSSRYVRFTLALDKVERNPAYTGEAARKWINDEISV